MGIFDRNENEDEVTINPGEENSIETKGNEKRLESEVESKVLNEDKNSGNEVSSIASGSKVSNGEGKPEKKNDISLSDVYRQNEKIIKLLEEISVENNDEDGKDFDGDLDGVL